MSTTPVLYQSSTPEALSEDQWTGLERTAKRLARVSWIPAAYKPCPPVGNKPGKTIEQAEAEIAAAGAALLSIGKDLTPMTLKLVYVVNGTVDFMYDLISAQVHAHGHELWIVDESPLSATVAGQRRGSSRVHTVTYTWDDAVRAGLTVRKDYKTGQMVPTETYAKNPRDMLVARAGKRCAKRVAPEALLTMPPPMSYAYTDTGRVHLTPIVHDVDDQDDVVDGELVEEGESCSITADAAGAATSPGRGVPTTTGAAPAGDTSSVRPAGPDSAPTTPSSGGTAPSGDHAATIEPEGGDNGATDRGVTAAPLPRLATGGVDWRDACKRHNVTQGDLLRKAQEFAKGRALPVPETLAEITDEQVVADLADWLGE